MDLSIITYVPAHKRISGNKIQVVLNLKYLYFSIIFFPLSCVFFVIDSYHAIFNQKQIRGNLLSCTRKSNFHTICIKERVFHKLLCMGKQKIQLQDKIYILHCFKALVINVMKFVRVQTKCNYGNKLKITMFV